MDGRSRSRYPQPRLGETGFSSYVMGSTVPGGLLISSRRYSGSPPNHPSSLQMNPNGRFHSNHLSKVGKALLISTYISNAVVSYNQIVVSPIPGRHRRPFLPVHGESQLFNTVCASLASCTVLWYGEISSDRRIFQEVFCNPFQPP